MSDQNTYMLREVTPLTDNDVLFVADRHKQEFTYPLHCQDSYELNFVENAAGVKRLVGDSVEVIGDYDLVLITSNELEHVWQQGDCKSKDIHEITVQFRTDFLDSNMFRLTPFYAINDLLRRAKNGIAFSTKAIMQVYNKLERLTLHHDKFHTFIEFLEILNILAKDENPRTLASSSFSKVKILDSSKHIQKVKGFINAHYMDEIKLSALADVACMSEASLSRSFKMHTGKTISEYIMDIRLGLASRMLLDTDKNVVDISFLCGYNNLSNFNRIFKRKKGCSPTEFREFYHKTKVIL